MKRSVIRESLVLAPDFAALDPGYMLRSTRETWANERYRCMPATEGRSRGSR
jgi:hypothetical protein